MNRKYFDSLSKHGKLHGIQRKEEMLIGQLHSYPLLLERLEKQIGAPLNFSADLLMASLKYIRAQETRVYYPQQDSEITDVCGWSSANVGDEFLILAQYSCWLFGGFTQSPGNATLFAFNTSDTNIQFRSVQGNVTLSSTIIDFAGEMQFEFTDELFYRLNQMTFKKLIPQNVNAFRGMNIAANGRPQGLEIYAIQGKKGDRARGTEIPCWREMQWSDKDLASLKHEVTQYKAPMAPFVRILLIGSVGSGKSSYFNTINSIYKGHVTVRAHSGTAEHSVTNKFRTYKIRSQQRGTTQYSNFQLCDTMGLEDDQGLDIIDFPYLLDGHVPDGFQFNPSARITPKSFGFIPSPMLAEKMHVICYVVDACSVEILSDGQQSIRKFKSLKGMAIERDLPIVILLTKIDKLCPLVAGDVSAVYKSKAVYQVVEKISALTGIPRCQVFPVKNYEHELELHRPIDILALASLRQIFRYADDYFDNM